MSVRRSIGHYRLIAELGQGGMARVYLALSERQPGFQKLFVVKVLRSEVSSDPEFVAMFLDEARIAARLSHENVIQTYEVGEADGRNFIAMEYLEGHALSAIHARTRRKDLPLALHVKILCDALAGLHYAHELRDYQGAPLDIVHRDVSPQNVFVTYTGHVKLLDFGIAKSAAAAVATRAGTIKGKIGYMAPEQALGQKVDRRSDIYAVGVMLWEAMAGRRLVARDEPEAITVQRRALGDIPAIKSINPDAPDELVAACERAMSVDLADRHPTAADLASDLAGYLKKAGAPDHRDIEALMRAHFSEDREKVRKTVEDHARRDAGSLAMLPVDPMGSSSASNPGPGVSVGFDKDSTVTQLATSPSPPKRRFAVIGVFIAVVIAVVGIGLYKGRPSPAAEPDRGPAAAVTGSPVPSPSAAGSSSSAPSDATKQFTVTVRPGSAHLKIDGVDVSVPHTLTEPPGGRHEAIASAPGHVTRTVQFQTGADEPLEIVLQRAPTVQAPTPWSPPRGTASAKADSVAAKPAASPGDPGDPVRPKKPKRDIDDKDPYQQ